MITCKHTYKNGIIKAWHTGDLNKCTHDCEKNHRVVFNQLYCDACGWEKTKRELREVGLPV